VVATGDDKFCEAVFFYSKTNRMHQFLKFILFCSSTLRVSDGLSVHHQESKTVYTGTGICQTDSADCLLVGMRWNWFSRLLNQFHLIPASKQSAESVWHMPVAVCTVLESWWWTERPSETRRVLLQNKINLRNWCILLVLLQKYITMHGPINVKIVKQFKWNHINDRRASI